MPFHFDMLLVDFYFRSKQNSKGNMPKNSNSHIVKPYDSAFHPVYRTEPVLVRLYLLLALGPKMVPETAPLEADLFLIRSLLRITSWAPKARPISSASGCHRKAKCVPTMKVVWNHERYSAPSTLLPIASTTLNPEKGSRLQLFRSLFRTDHATAPPHHNLYGRLCINSAFAQLPRRNVGLLCTITLHQRINKCLATLLMFS